MLNLNEKNFFFFYEDCSNCIIRPNTVEHAYLVLLNGNLDEAYNIFLQMDSARSKWGEILVMILRGELLKFPTYFQVRNFFEIDLDLLLKNEKISYVEQLLGALELLFEVNNEIYKYTARVMYENKLYSAALKYMQKSKKVYYNDAELHFLFAKYYLRIKDYEKALFYIEECRKLIPEYYPAMLLAKEIDERWI